MAEIALLIVSSLINMGLVAAVVIWDRKKLSAEQRERGWNGATFGSAVFAFSPWCIVAHFWVTRRSVRGVLLGLLWLAILLVAIVLINSLVAMAFGLGGD
ncbi:MAG: hypothetical protein HY898_20570 [Deltaproteobacteria bacterium]|nr:hypothetical protein [Deltaproteobacteria bacterium]